MILTATEAANGRIEPPRGALIKRGSPAFALASLAADANCLAGQSQATCLQCSIDASQAARRARDAQERLAANSSLLLV